MTKPLSTKKKSTNSQEPRTKDAPWKCHCSGKWKSATRIAQIPRQLSSTTYRSAAGAADAFVLIEPTGTNSPRKGTAPAHQRSRRLPFHAFRAKQFLHKWR